MGDYTTWNYKPFKPANISREWLDREMKKAVETDKTDQDRYMNWMNQYNAILTATAKLWGKDGNIYAFLLRQEPAAPAVSNVTELNKLVRSFNEYEAATQEHDRVRERRRQSRIERIARQNAISAHIEDAVVALIGRGLALGVDFHLEDAVQRLAELSVKSKGEVTDAA